MTGNGTGNGIGNGIGNGSERGHGPACARLRELDAELALGALPARERAEAVAHLDRCPDCREYVERLNAVGDGLLALLPEAEPPVGFESRVVRALGAAPEASEAPEAAAPQPAPARPSRTRLRARRLRLAAAGAAAAVACAFGGWAVGTAVEGPAAVVAQRVPAALHEAALVAPGGHEVGRIYAHPAGAGAAGWVYMTVELPGAGAGPVRCVLVRADGSTVPVGSFRLHDGYGYWGAPAGTDPASAAGARLLAPDGTVLATARFPGG
jgi:anti-sigma-K factor RskA